MDQRISALASLFLIFSLAACGKEIDYVAKYCGQIDGRIYILGNGDVLTSHSTLRAGKMMVNDVGIGRVTRVTGQVVAGGESKGQYFEVSVPLVESDVNGKDRFIAAIYSTHSVITRLPNGDDGSMTNFFLNDKSQFVQRIDFVEKIENSEFTQTFELCSGQMKTNLRYV